MASQLTCRFPHKALSIQSASRVMRESPQDRKNMNWSVCERKIRSHSSERLTTFLFRAESNSQEHS
jgi:hypothetical protein